MKKKDLENDIKKLTEALVLAHTRVVVYRQIALNWRANYLEERYMNSKINKKRLTVDQEAKEMLKEKK